jgi:TPR repeat protein
MIEYLIFLAVVACGLLAVHFSFSLPEKNNPRSRQGTNHGGSSQENRTGQLETQDSVFVSGANSKRSNRGAVNAPPQAESIDRIDRTRNRNAQKRVAREKSIALRTSEELYVLGIRHENGYGTPRDLRSAINYYISAARTGHPHAQYRLGRIYALGKEIAQNLDLAEKWLRQAANSGVPGAKRLLERMAVPRNEGGQLDELEELKLASVDFANANPAKFSPEAQFEIGLLLEHGYGVRSDIQKAVTFFSSAADNGHGAAQYYLGRLYAQGTKVDRNVHLASEWLGKARDSGVPGASVLLGKIACEAGADAQNAAPSAEAQLQANLSSLDPEIAGKRPQRPSRRQDLQVLADSGSAEAQRKLGIYFLDGPSNKRSPEEANKWLTRSAELGDTEAQLRLAKMLLAGVGSEKDPAAAAAWFKAAANSGDTDECMGWAEGLFSEALTDGGKWQAIEFLQHLARAKHAASRKALRSALGQMRKSGDAKACRALAELYAERKTESSIKNAIACFAEARSAGDMSAAFDAGIVSLSSADRSVRDGAIEWFELAAQEDASRAAECSERFVLADGWTTGSSLSFWQRSSKRRRKFLKRAATLGSSTARQLIEKYGFDETALPERQQESAQTDDSFSSLSEAETAAREMAPHWSATDCRDLACVLAETENSTISGRTQIQQIIDEGMTPVECQAAARIRKIWQQHPEYCDGDKGYRIVPWRLAQRLATAIGPEASDEQFKSHLEEFFDEWSVECKSGQTTQAFSQFVSQRIQVGSAAPDSSPAIPVQQAVHLVQAPPLVSAGIPDRIDDLVDPLYDELSTSVSAIWLDESAVSGTFSIQRPQGPSTSLDAATEVEMGTAEKEPALLDTDWLPTDGGDIQTQVFGDDLEDYESEPFIEFGDFDDAMVPPPDGVPQLNRITRELRAYQEASKLGAEFGWDEGGVRLISEVFTRYSWARAKSALREQLRAGMTPDQLRVALLARDVWATSSQFHVYVSTDEYRTFTYEALSWSMAKALAEELGEDASEEEVMLWLDEQHDEWRSSRSRMSEHPAFYNFVRGQLGLLVEEPSKNWYYR